jgi:hypothetical protein
MTLHQLRRPEGIQDLGLINMDLSIHAYKKPGKEKKTQLQPFQMLFHLLL